MSSPELVTKLESESDPPAVVIKTQESIPAQDFPHAVPVSGLGTGNAFTAAAKAELPAVPIQAATPQAGTNVMTVKQSKAAVTARRKNFATLVQAEDRAALAAEWANPSAPLLDAAFSSAEAFDFFRALTPAKRKLVEVSDVQAGQALTNEQWSLRKWEHIKTWSGFDDSDRSTLAEQFGLAVKSEVFIEAIRTRENYRFFRDLPPEHRSVVNEEEVRKRKTPDPAVLAERRLSLIETLSEEDKTALAAEWNVPRDGRLFEAAIGSQKSYDFVRKQKYYNRRVLTDDEVKKAVAVKAEVLKERRWESLDTMSPEDKAEVKKSWAPFDSPPDYQARVDTAFADNKVYLYFSQLSDDERRYVTDKRFKACLPPVAVNVAEAKSQAEAAAKKQAVQDKKQALGKAKLASNAEKLKEWDKEEKGLRIWVSEQTKNGILPSDFKWEPDVDEILARFRDDIRSDSNVKSRVKLAKKKIADHVTREAKRKYIETDTSYGKLRILAELKKTYIENDALTYEDFRKRAKNELDSQRNPAKLEIWARWMNVEPYTPGNKMLKLGQVGDPPLKAHMTFELTALSFPFVDDNTTADKLLNRLFRVGVPHLHVTLETEVENLNGGNEFPHRYWATIGNAPIYGLDFKDTDGVYKPRWKPTHTEAKITSALDAAYDDLMQRLKTRAEEIIKNGGGP